MPEPIPERLRGRPFTAADARRHGLSKRRLQADDLCAPFHGVRSSGSVTTVAECAKAVQPRLGADQWVTGRGAAAVWGLPLPVRGPKDVEVAVAKSGTRVTGRGLAPRELKPELLRGSLVDGIAVTEPVLTWCTLAKYSTVEELVRIGDAIVSDNPDYAGRRSGFVAGTVEDLSTAVDQWRGCLGIGKLRQALSWVRVGVASPPETDLRLLVMDAGLPEFEVNQPLHDDAGNLIAVVDGLIRTARLVFEYEGDGHRTDQQQFRKDIRRYDQLQAMGYTVCRATADDVYRMRRQFKVRARAAYRRATSPESAR